MISSDAVNTLEACPESTAMLPPSLLPPSLLPLILLQWGGGDSAEGQVCQAGQLCVVQHSHPGNRL